MQSPHEVIDQVRRVLATEPHVRWAYVFGSVVRAGRYRDVDVALMPAATMPTGAVAWGRLVAALEQATGAKVDLVDLSQQDLPFVGPMLTERRIVIENDAEARRAWEAETTSRWLDFKPAYDEFMRVRDLAMRARLRGAG